MKRLAVIPARGGSKRLPRKNIMPLAGKPMMAWTIEAALGAHVFDRVLVSTDDAEIAEIAQGLGAEAPFLRGANADDYATVSEAVVTALHQAEQFWDETYDTVVQLMPNCPLRTAADIVSGLNHFHLHPHLVQISAFRFGWMNPWWAFKLSEEGEPQPMFEGSEAQRSQDLPPLYAPTGALWIADRAAIVASGTFYGEGWRIFELDWMSAIDIDERGDLLMAEMAMAVREMSG